MKLKGIVSKVGLRPFSVPYTEITIPILKHDNTPGNSFLYVSAEHFKLGQHLLITIDIADEPGE